MRSENIESKILNVKLPHFLLQRRVVKCAVVLSTVLLLGACGSGSGSGSTTAVKGTDLDSANAFASNRTKSFDEGWLFYKGTLSADAASSANFTDTAWRHLDLPHDWSIEDLPGGTDDGGATSQPSNLFFFEQPSLTAAAPARIGPFDKIATEGDRATGRTVGGGDGWYRKHFNFTPSGNQRAEIRFDGVYQNSDVWINGQHLGFHPYGYTEFTYDLTPYLKSGDNVLVVRAQNSRQNSRWYSGSGIYRHTWLTITDGLRIPVFGVGLTTQTLTATEASVSIQVSVQNTLAAAATVTVNATFFDAQGNQVAESTSDSVNVKAGTNKDISLTLAVPNPRPWSPDTPTLYTAVVRVISKGDVKDLVTETFGIRTVQVSGTDGFILNGAPLKLRGGNMHDNHGPLGAVTLGDDEYWRLSTLKKEGFNAVRTAHNPPSQELLKAADQMGIILLDEFVDMWTVAKNPDDYHLYFTDWWERDVESWVLASRNHPSVGIWSIANEILDSASAEPIGAQLAAKVRALDGSRPVMQGGAQGIINFFNSPTTAPYTDIGDVHYQMSYVLARQEVPSKPWLQSESYPASLYDNWKLVTDNSFAIGDFVWTAWDYLGEAGLNVPRFIAKDSDTETAFLELSGDMGAQSGGVWAPYPWFAAGAGDFDLIGQVSPQHLYRRVVWGNSLIEMAVARPVSKDPISGADRQQQAFNFSWFDELESWTWDVAANTQMRVHVYTSADRVDLFLNDNLIDSHTLSATDKLIGSFWVAYQPGTLRAVAYRNGSEIGRKELVSTGSPAALTLTSDTLSLTTSRDALAHVLAQVVDNNGRLVPDAVVRVSFTVSSGELAAVGSGNAHNVDSFKRGKRYSYHGKAMAYVRSSKTPGTIVVTASADGLTPASLELTVQ